MLKFSLESLDHIGGLYMPGGPIPIPMGGLIPGGIGILIPGGPMPGGIPMGGIPGGPIGLMGGPPILCGGGIALPGCFPSFPLMKAAVVASINDCAWSSIHF